MSSDPPSGGRSAASEPGPGLDLTIAPGDAEVARQRGELLVGALERRLPGAREHAHATASYAFATAVQLELDREVCVLVREAARLHEVGRIYQGADPAGAEPASHIQAGYRLALGAGVPEQACLWILRCGDRFDRQKDPHGPAARRLPPGIIAAACEYDTLLHEQPEGGGGRRLAFIDLIGEAGGRLDPLVVDALARVIERAAGRVEHT